MHGATVLAQAALVSKRALAHVTDVRFLSRMTLGVRFQAIVRFERLWAELTLKRRALFVHQLVGVKHRRRSEAFVALCTMKRPLDAVHLCVCAQRAFVEERRTWSSKKQTI